MAVAANAARSRQRRVVGRGGDDDRPLQTLRTEIVLDETAHFASPLSHERNDDDVRRRAARQHAEQCALADTRTAEEPDALPAAAGEQRVDGADTTGQRRHDRIAFHRVQRRRMDRIETGGRHGTEAVERLSQGVDDAAEQLRADADITRTASGDDAVTRLYADGVAKRYGEDDAIAKSDDLNGQRRGAVPADHLTGGADADPRSL